MPGINFLVLFLSLIAFPSWGQEIKIYLSPVGNDINDGTQLDFPKRTLGEALEQVKKLRSNTELASIILLPGEYYLKEPLTLGTEIGPLSIISSNDGNVVIKGSEILSGKWENFSSHIMMMKLNDEISPFSNLYINGIEQHLARYPDFDSAISPFSGYAADVISPERVLQWAHPEGAILHAMHQGEWGDFHYVIEAVNKNGKVKLTGGHQNNRPAPMHEKYRFIENVFEELNAPGEWYFDKEDSTLYIYPSGSINLNEAKIEVTKLDRLLEIKGLMDDPIRNITIEGIRFEHVNQTFMEQYEPLLRSDWTIYRGGAIFFENAENCQVLNCEFIDLGGNAIFISGYNRNITIQGNHIYNCGATGISFVGFPSAVRSPSFNYNEFVPLEEMDFGKGPKTMDYPMNCTVDNNLIHHTGRIEKQTAGVQISMAMNITVSHNSIYDVPRAGINVSEGTWGGHIIEFNDVFNTVLETSDHGAFNSWGRDRFWHPDRKTMDNITKENPDMPYLDAVNTTIIRNNRFRCDHGWDIDLDDGSSNYHIYNNLCLNGGIKLREGFYRTVENNIMVNNGFHPHVWFDKSGDVFRRNIVMTEHKDIRLLGWGKEVDYNLFPDSAALEKAQQNGTDMHSDFGDPMFFDPKHGDFSVSDLSPAIELGFINFTMDQFGVQKPELRRIVKSPVIPELLFPAGSFESINTADWLGAKLKNIESLEDRSAAGLFASEGVMITNLDKNSLSELAGLMEGDVIIRCEENKIENIGDLLKCYQGNNWKGKLNMIIIRNQQEQEILLTTK